MKRNIKLVIFLFSVISSLFLFFNCRNSIEPPSSVSWVFSSYRNIPGVTSEEIEAIEALRENYDFFIYGMLPSTEAFDSIDGEIKGFAALYSEWLTGLFGIPFIPKLHTWNDLLEGLQTREIDFTGELTATPERRQTYLMTDAIAQRSIEYIRLKNSPPLLEITSSRLPRYALLAGTTTADDVFSKALEAFEVVFITEYIEAYELLKAGEIDALVAEGPNLIIFDMYDDIVTTIFLPLIYSTVSFSTQNPELSPFISVMQKALDNGAINYLNELYTQGHQDYTQNTFFIRLTDDELKFINENPIIPIVAEYDNYPISFYNFRENAWQGLSFDILREIETLTGLKFTLINDQYTEWPQLYKMLEDGEALIISELIKSQDREGRFLWPETTFLTDQSALISKVEHRNININEILSLRVGLNRGTVHTELFNRWFPDHRNTVEFDGQDAAFDALTRGEIDMVMSIGFRILSLTNYRELPGYKINFLFENSLNSTFGINRDAIVLLSIIENALELINVRAISGQWMRRTYDYRLKIAEARIPWVVGVALTLMLMLILLACLFLKDRKIRKTISEQAAVLSAVYNSIPVMVFTKDLNYRYTSCNNKFIEDVKIAESALINNNLRDTLIFERSIAEEFSEIDKKILNEGITITTEGWYKYADGSRRAREITKTPLILDGKVAGLLGVMADINYRKLMEEAVNKEHEQAMLMLDSSPLCIQLWDKNLNTIYCNDEAVRLYGFNNKQEYLDRFLKDCSPEYQPDGQRSEDKAIMLVNKAFREGKCVFNWMHKMPDNTPIPAEVSLVRVNYKDDYLVVGYTEDLRDVTRLEEEASTFDYAKKLSFILSKITKSPTISAGYLKEAAELIAREGCEVLNVSRVGIWNIIDNGKTLTSISCYDAARKECFIQDNFDISNRIEYRHDLETERLIVTNDVSSSNMLSDLLEDYAPESCAMIDIPIRIDGNLAGVVCIEQDRSDIFSVKREWMIEEQNFASSLADLMALAISSSERRIAKEDAETANKAKSAFLAAMSHEIRTPMYAIIGMSELILSDDINIHNDNCKNHLNHIQDIHVSAIALLNIINDILDYSKIQSGKMDIVPAHYDFSVFLSNINSMAHFLLKDKKIIYKQLIEGDLPRFLYGSEIRLRQVILNLVGNAIKFTDEGTVTLSISATDTSIIFDISDTGIGIAEKDIPLLFNHFTQVDALRNRTKQGTGLGLSITKSLIDLMEGEISMKSVYGQGTVFHVKIPKILGEETLIQESTPTGITLSAPDAKVLVVDDNLINLNVSTGLLKQYNINAQTCTSGWQAIDLINENQYDLVLMDHMMPGLDGVETTKKIRDAGIKVPIIAFTANAISDVKDEFLAAGMNDLLTKPIKRVWLNKILKDWLPAEKLTTFPDKMSISSGSLAQEGIINNYKIPEEDDIFWQKVKQIKGLSILTGLERVSGQRDNYEKSLKMLINEIEKCDKNMNDFLATGDMRNFLIEVHGMKSSLANIGAMELSAIAQRLENAANNEDAAFCSANIRSFLEGLNVLCNDLVEAFAYKTPSQQSSFEISQELSSTLHSIFEMLKIAFAETDVFSINEGIESLNALNPEGLLKEKIEKIKDAVLLMDYDSAMEIISSF